MGQVRHGSATTTHAVRAAIQRSQASTAALSRDFGINPKTVAKWRKRETAKDRKSGPKEPRSTVLSEAFYGSHVHDEPGYRAAYLRHEAEVMALHGGQENFMAWDLTEGQGWEPLCRFLDKPVPTVPFPVSNKGRPRA